MRDARECAEGRATAKSGADLTARHPACRSIRATCSRFRRAAQRRQQVTASAQSRSWFPCLELFFTAGEISDCPNLCHEKIAHSESPNGGGKMIEGSE